MTKRGRCNLCGSHSTRDLFSARDRLSGSQAIFSIVLCKGCGVMRTMPELSDRDLAAFYPEDYWGADPVTDPEWIKSSQWEKLRFLSKCDLTGGSILDVGCGAGLFLRALDAAKWDRYGVENGAEAARVALQTSSGRIFAGNLIQAGLPASTFDVVTFWSALEHMNDPKENLLEARRLLKPGGTVVVQVPNAGSWQARAFGGKWFALDAPRHRYHFTEATMGRLLRETGLVAYEKTTFSRAHNVHAFRQSLKAGLDVNKSLGRYLLFCALIPGIKPADFLCSALGKGATLTIAARMT